MQEQSAALTGDEQAEYLRSNIERNAIIEECARVAESFQLAGAIAAAIRALKSNTGG